MTEAIDYHVLPNFPPRDTGIVVTYAANAFLKNIHQLKAGKLDGPWISFEPNGTMDTSLCKTYKDGQIESGYISADGDDLKTHISLALVQLAVPMKKALGIGLSPGEKRLCVEYRLSVDSIDAMDLNRDRGAGTEHKQWELDRVDDPLRPKRLIAGGELVRLY